MPLLEPDTEIELTLAIGGIRASAKFTVAKPMAVDGLRDLAAKRAPKLVDDAFDLFIDGFAQGFISKQLDDEDGDA